MEHRGDSSNVSARVRRWLLSPVQAVPLVLQTRFDAFALIELVGRQLHDLSSLQYSEEDAWDAGGLLGEGPEPEDTSEEALRVRGSSH